MSMLAEPRRKQKVINLRAKNNAWSNDSTKFGQRMLEKMGWSSGKGLGAKENGIVEHVVARYKNDEKGLGFEDRNDQWTKHDEDFNSLLANLSNADSTNSLHSGISLEKKSKKSKARIHYHKFTRGKDLSRYSEKDLANIFGKKSFKEPEKECLKEDTIKSTEQVFTEKGNMDDYFKNKLAAFKSKSKVLNPDTSSKTNESDYAFQGFSNATEPESNQNESGYQPFCFYNSQKESVSQNVEITCPDVETKHKKKKKSKQKEISSEGDKNYLTEQEASPEILIDVESTKVKKSKKKKNTDCIKETQLLNISNECVQNAAQELQVDVGSLKVKKSKKKKHKDLVVGIDIVGESCPSVSTLEEGKNNSHQECVENEIEPCEEFSKIKKKKNKNNVNPIQQSCMEDNVPKKKKKRKNIDL